MFTISKRVGLLLVTMSGLGLASCQKDLATPVGAAQEEAVRIKSEFSRSSMIQLDNKLLQKMAADAKVKQLILDSYQFAADYEAAIQGMSPAARKAYFTSQKGVGRASQIANYLVRTPERMAEFYTTQFSRVADMKQRFPAYEQLGDSEHAAFTARLVQLVVKGNTEARLAPTPCSAGYTACMTACGSNTGLCADGCWAGLKACLDTTYPAP